MPVIREHNPNPVYETKVERESTALAYGLGILLLAAIGILIFFAVNSKQQTPLTEQLPQPETTTITPVPFPQPYAVPVPHPITVPVPQPVTIPVPTPSSGQNSGTDQGQSNVNRDTPSGTSSSSQPSSSAGTVRSTIPMDDAGTNMTDENSATGDGDALTKERRIQT
jgi:outer membrane biosynthesis protein TonB